MNLLFVDYYEFTSRRAKLDFDRNKEITETYFFRKPMVDYSYMLAVGQHHFVDFIMEMNEGTITEDIINWLEKTGGGDLNQKFLDYLSNFKFTGTVEGVKVGTPVYGNEPILNVTGNSIDVQLLETYLLHVMNTQSPVATVSSRLRSIAKDKSVVDFGARRSYNPMLTAEAAVIGGADGTSLVQAGMEYNIPYIGTIPHKFIQERWDGKMSFSDSELIAFREYSLIFPHNTILLVDTYNTANGILNAIIIARELRSKGHELVGIRLDSGDLAVLSRMARHMLDSVGFPGVKIFVSDNITPTKMAKLLYVDNAPIDGFGVGTNLVHPHEALGGVYKITQSADVYYMKFTDNPFKMTLPGRRTLWRSYREDGTYWADYHTLYDETIPSIMDGEGNKIIIDNAVSIHHTLFADNQPYKFPTALEMRDYSIAETKRVPLMPPPIVLSTRLEQIRNNLIERYNREFEVK